VAIPGELPVPATPFIGRAGEVVTVCRRLQRGDVRFLVISGPGGVGKTRLALEAGARLRPSFADGVRFVPLAAVRDPGLVLAAVARALGLRDVPERSLPDELRLHLRERAVLLILDNFEHLTAAATGVNRLLAGCPRLKVLVTSRAVLRVYGAYEHPLPAMALPDADLIEAAAREESPSWRVGALERLAESEAVSLFVARAEAAEPGLALTDGDAVAVAQICRQLDGLPLAIELAAARVRLLPPPAMLARLTRRLPLLTAGPWDAPVRQRTLHHTIAWSYDLLTPAEQRLFRALAVFAGGFDLAAVGAVVDDPSSAVDLLAALQDQSLLYREPGPALAPAEPRYTMLETVREYALERLAESGEDAAVRRRHAAHFVSLAEAAEAALDGDLRGPPQAFWFDQLAREHANLREALTWLDGCGEVSDALKLATRLCLYWINRGYRAEGRSWLVRLLDRPGAGGTPALRAMALAQAGYLAFLASDVAQAQPLLQRSVALGQELRAPGTVSRALFWLGMIARSQGDYVGGRLLAEKSLHLARAAGDTQRAAWARGLLGSLLVLLGEAEAAYPLLQETLSYYLDRGDTSSVAYVTFALGNLALQQGNAPLAGARMAEALRLFREVGDRGGTATARHGLGQVACLEQRYGQARAHLEESLGDFRELREQYGAARVLASLGLAARAQADPDEARAAFGGCLRVARPLGFKPVLVPALEGMAGVILAAGRPATATRLLAAADAARATLEIPRQALERRQFEDDLVAARAALGEAAFAVSWSVGSAISLDDAVELALAAPDGGPEDEEDGAPAASGRVAPLAVPARQNAPAGTLSDLAPLSRREREVASLIAEGLTNREIAHRLLITEGTAANHIVHILNKLGFSSRVHVAAWVARGGLTPSLPRAELHRVAPSGNV
jgi:predicted ATPase/DNA-binding CsgD family transcriptional regulator